MDRLNGCRQRQNLILPSQAHHRTHLDILAGRIETLIYN